MAAAKADLAGSSPVEYGGDFENALRAVTRDDALNELNPIIRNVIDTKLLTRLFDEYSNLDRVLYVLTFIRGYTVAIDAEKPDNDFIKPLIGKIEENLKTIKAGNQ
jgi:hypothetical protein